jgi:hypothetical protein
MKDPDRVRSGRVLSRHLEEAAADGCRDDNQPFGFRIWSGDVNRWNGSTRYPPCQLLLPALAM